MGTCFSVLIRMELAGLRDQIIPHWMYPSGADVGSQAIVNQKQHQPSRPGGPAAPIENGSESASTYSAKLQSLAAKPYITLLQKQGERKRRIDDIVDFAANKLKDTGQPFGLFLSKRYAWYGMNSRSMATLTRTKFSAGWFHKGKIPTIQIHFWFH